MNFIKHFKNIIKVIRRKVHQSLIVKIHIREFHTATGKSIVTQRGLTAAPHTNHNLRLCTGKIYFVLFRTCAKTHFFLQRQFLCLICKYSFKYPFIHLPMF